MTTTMTTKQLVDRGIEINFALETLKDELKLIEERLKQAALAGEQIELTDPDREGRQYLAHGTTHTVPVVLTADIIAGQFADGSPMHAAASAAAGSRLGDFYREIRTWKNMLPTGKAFRAQAADLLGNDAGPRLVSAVIARDKLGIPRNQIKVEWDRAEKQ
jgi:hypothetical protein